MRILAVETSCDETSIAILESRNGKCRVLSNIVSSQIDIHAPFGGVVPHLAKREHQKNLVPILLTALKASELEISKSNFLIAKQIIHSKSELTHTILEREQELLKQFNKYVLRMPTPNIDVIAVTAGPGLEPALWVGVNFAKALAILWQKPLVPINHLEGHIYSNWLKQTGEFSTSNFKFPILNLIVSGGHTLLVLMKDHRKYECIGETVDDAAGETFDKVARLLQLPYPGGPEIAMLAETGNPKAFPFPRPMLKQQNYNFSFSGLKTAVFYTLRNLSPLTVKRRALKADIAASFQQAVVDVLVTKTVRAATTYNIKTVLLSGGVSANKELRRQLQSALRDQLPSIKYRQPLFAYTGDNAAMIAMAAQYRIKKQKTLISRAKTETWIKKITADANKQLTE